MYENFLKDDYAMWVFGEKIFCSHCGFDKLKKEHLTSHCPQCGRKMIKSPDLCDNSDYSDLEKFREEQSYGIR